MWKVIAIAALLLWAGAAHAQPRAVAICDNPKSAARLFASLQRVRLPKKLFILALANQTEAASCKKGYWKGNLGPVIDRVISYQKGWEVLVTMHTPLNIWTGKPLYIIVFMRGPIA